MSSVATQQHGRFPRWGYLDKFSMNEYMSKSLLVGVALSFALIGLYAGWQGIKHFRHRQQESVVGRRPTKVKILTAADLGVPPSLSQQTQQAVKVEVKARPAVAMPVPVPDEQAVDQTIATTEEISAYSGNANQNAAGFGGSDSLVIDSGSSGLPSPDDYVAYEKAPDLVSMKEPLYPDIAREAGVEGTVLIRVLVGEDGFVKDKIIVQSVGMLDEAAAAAAETAVFKPAMQKDKPVAVWMVIPIEFRLHN